MLQENVALQKGMLKIEDKSLVKNLQKNVKKMIKPFKGLQFDEYLNNEVHLNQIMSSEEQRNDLRLQSLPRQPFLPLETIWRKPRPGSTRP